MVTIRSAHRGTDSPLTATGEATARTPGARLRRSPCAHVLVSPLARARRTCVLDGLNPSAKQNSDLAVWDGGDDAGERSADILRTRPHWDLCKDRCPGGESPDPISHRADRLIAQSCTSTPAPTAALTRAATPLPADRWPTAR